MVDYPITIEQGEIKIKAETMEVDKLYHCLYKEKVMLFFKDKNDLLNCYEIDDKEIVDTVRQSGEADIEKILEKFIKERNLGASPGEHSH